MIQVRQYSDFGELEKFEPFWNDLLQKSRDSDVFATWEWLSCYWKHFGKNQELRVLIAEENSNIMAIAPLMLSKYSFMSLRKMTKLEFIGGPHSAYNNIIWLGKEEQCLELFLKHLMEQRDWDWLDLTNVREETLSAKLLSESHAALSQKLENKVFTLCPYIELPNSIDAFMKMLGTKKRKDVRRLTRRFSEEYVVGLKTQKDFGSVEQATDLMFDLHQRRWNAKGELSAWATRQVSEFHRDLANAFDKRGWLALSFLTANEEPVAALYSFDYQGKRYYYQSGFDPRFARYGVGDLLIMRNIEVCIGKGLKEFDFMIGPERYKSFWPTQIRKNLRIELVRRGFFHKLAKRVPKNKTTLIVAKKLRRNLGIDF